MKCFDRGLPAAVLVAASVVSAAAPGEPADEKPKAAGTVVFVCEHGTVKSLIAREWFNRLAAERGLRFRAVSRGVAPETSVPPAIADALRLDGFEVGGFEPRALTPADRAAATRVVSIGADLSSVEGRAGVPTETWEGIPPATERYAAARDALRARIESLLDALQGPGRHP